LVMVSVCGAVAVFTALAVKESEVGDTLKSAGAVPVRATDCGLVESPSTMVRVADSEVVDGSKVTLIVQPAVGMVGPQVVALTAKSVPAGLAFVMVALAKGIAALVLLVRVTVCAAVGVPMAVAVKESERGETTRVGSRVSEAAKPSAVLVELNVVSNAPVVAGRFVDKVCPLTYTVGGVAPRARLWI